MTTAMGDDFRCDIVRAGKLKFKSRLFGISRSCFVELKRSSGALVKYHHSNSTYGRFYDLSRVQMVNYLHPNQQGFAVEFHNSHTLTFYCPSQAETVKWYEAIRDLCRERSATNSVRSMRMPVELLPTRSLHFSGACQLNITATSVYVVDVNDPGRHTERRRVVWPISSINHCGFHRELLLLHTKESCETKSGEFVFIVHPPVNAGDVCRQIFAAMTSGSNNNAPNRVNASRKSPGNYCRSHSMPEMLHEDLPTSPRTRAVSSHHVHTKGVHLPPLTIIDTHPRPSTSQMSPSLPSPCHIRLGDQRLKCVESTGSRGFRIQLPIPSPTSKSLSPSPRTPTKHSPSMKHSSSLNVIHEPTGEETDTEAPDTSTTVVVEEFSTIPNPPLLGLDSARCSLIRLTHRGGEEEAIHDGSVGEFPAGCGVLLYGPPGCGKRSLSRWFAAECQSRLISIDCRKVSGHLSEQLTTALDKARSGAPCVIYLENVDAVSDGEGLEKITEALDAVDCTTQTMFIAATTFPDRADTSLTAPGRFAEQIYVAPPDECTRQRIVNERLQVLGTSAESTEYILRRAKEIVNATPDVLLDLCDRLSALLVGRGTSVNSSPPSADTVPAPPALTARQKPLDQAVDAARRRVVEGKDSMEACAAKWIERSQRDGWFVVEVEGEELQLKNVGVCLLNVDVDAVRMYELNASGAELVSWPIAGIRRFGFEPLCFTIETGRSCPDGEGTYALKTNRAEELSDRMLSVTKRY